MLFITDSSPDSIWIQGFLVGAIVASSSIALGAIYVTAIASGGVKTQ